MKYEKQVSLLIDLIPIIASDDAFALKGGTAINLFYQDMPRLSVDLDLVYLQVQGRDQTLALIDQKLGHFKYLITKRYPHLKVKMIPPSPELSRQIIVTNLDVQVKIEVNTVIRGTLYPVSKKSLSQEVQRAFKKNATMQVVSLEDLYGSKICASLDRQHPRDLYDMMLFLKYSRITREIFESFLFYLISHGRPISELIAPNMLDIKNTYEKDFVGMTKEEVTLLELQETRNSLIQAIQSAFTENDKNFLLSFNLNSAHLWASHLQFL
jgi:predicted nucleotidyltransferase component of viral defense system